MQRLVRSAPPSFTFRLEPRPSLSGAAPGRALTPHPARARGEGTPSCDKLPAGLAWPWAVSAPLPHPRLIAVPPRPAERLAHRTLRRDLGKT